MNVPHNPQNSPKKELQLINFKAEHHSGPFPPPAMMEEYERIVPGAAAVIMKMAQDQTAHRISIESKVIDTDARNSTLGVVCAAVITLSSFALAAYALYLKQTWVGTFLGTVSIGSVVGAFLQGTHSRREEREKRLNK